ncbi:MAG: hypothetical protein HOB37_12885 [Rhodospirillaceae bacterium]|nr:hypothetical protein [Rhodospirillaceae bacterium]MBT3908200.1 hypothetical protein [Rhodospirillaceae bacterium]MBT5298244.1 hypothetical protein [Rhodospirillaceae bacterium]MBT5513003.1 hypothetical protein [Rhodospirillaceae bacterium]MBT6086072.1 hypothetical protein [Rhodospirillaceae bacterium]
MADYIQYFIEHSGQITAIYSVAIVWLGLLVFGGAVGGAQRERAFDPLVGWALVSLVFTLSGVFLNASFQYLAGGTLAAAVGAGIWIWRRDGALVPSALLKMILIASPLLILVSAMHASQWDEFSGWLSVPRYLMDTDALPSRANPYINSALPGYPFSWHYVTFLASLMAGYLLENAGALSNVLLLLMFGVMVSKLIARGAGNEASARAPGWSLLAIGALATTLLNPTFAQKIVLTTYADTSSAVAMGAAVVLAWFIIEELAAGRDARLGALSWQMGAVLLVLISLKQATPALAGLTVLAMVFVALRDGAVKISRLARLLPAIVGPPLIIFFAWRYHLSIESNITEMRIAGFDEWLIAYIPDIVGRMLLVLSKKGYYLVLVVLVVVIGVRGFIRSETPLDRFAALAAMVVLGYNAFLLFSYVTVFGKFDALRAASYWRYNMHLGLVVVAFTAYGAATYWRCRLAERWPLSRLSWLPIALLIIAPLVFAPKLRFDRAPWTNFYRTVSIDVAELLQPGNGLVVLDPAGSGESAQIMAFNMRPGMNFRGYRAAFDVITVKIVTDLVRQDNISHILIHSHSPHVGTVFGDKIVPGQSYLFKKLGPSSWETLGQWPHPKNAKR